MSLHGKIVFATACAFSIGIISYVHYRQFMDRELLHRGVLRDIELRQKRKTENVYTLQKQIELTKEWKKKEESGG